ncbi:MAG: histidine kinase dimerization/phosphoacceptor domain -containing protein [Nitrospirota bacterium]
MKNDDYSKDIFLQKMLEWEDLFDTMVTVHDKDFNIIMANKSAEKILGRPFIQISREKCYASYHGKDSPPEGCASCECLKTRKPAVFESYEPHLKMFLEIRAIPRLNGNGEIKGLIHVVRDITDRKEMEKKIKSSLKEKEVLLSEIHHRVGNSLQVIYGLLNIQSDSIDDKKCIDVFKGCQNRIISMALVHRTIYKSKDFTHINFHEYISKLTENLYQSFNVSTDDVSLRINVDDVSIAVDTAIPCGLIISELVSNSLKHAFPDGRNGEIRIELHPVDEKIFELIVGDNGAGISADIDVRNTDTLGFKTLFSYEGSSNWGKFELNRENGTEFRIRFKDKALP